MSSKFSVKGASTKSNKKKLIIVNEDFVFFYYNFFFLPLSINYVRIFDNRYKICFIVAHRWILLTGTQFHSVP